MKAKYINSIALLALMMGAQGCSQSDPGALVWPQWRGAEGSGISYETGVPVRWTADEGIRWAAELPGSGISSPIVGSGAVYLTADRGTRTERELLVLALDLATGEMLWETKVASRPPGKLHRLNSSASATPATDGSNIYAHFGSHLASLDTRGKLRWVKEIDHDYLEFSHYGSASSVVLTDDAVVVMQDREEQKDKDGWLAAFSKDTGERVWRKRWDNSCCSYITPLLIDLVGEPELIVGHAGKMMSYDPKTGDRLWRREMRINQPVASPVGAGQILCLASGAHNIREMGCFQVTFNAESKRRKLKHLWRSRQGVPGTASPILYNDLFFVVHEKGIVACHNAITGKRIWRARLRPGSYHASPVLAEGKIYATELSGVTSVFAAAGKFELIAENPLPEGGVVASAAIADGCMLVRGRKHLYCIEGAEDAAVAAASSSS